MAIFAKDRAELNGFRFCLLLEAGRYGIERLLDIGLGRCPTLTCDQRYKENAHAYFIDFLVHG